MQDLSFYEMLAPVYDGLNADADYEKIRRFIAHAVAEFGVDVTRVLDAGCGTGSLTLLLAEDYPSVMGADGSEEMLCMAQNKAFAAGKSVFFVCQELTELDLGCAADLIVSTMDTLNHLPDEAAFSAALSAVARHLAKGGLFIFDLNTPFKHEQVLGNHTIVKESGEAFCVWENAYDPQDGSVTMEINLFTGDFDSGYDRETAAQREILLSEETLQKACHDAGLTILCATEDYSQLPPSAHAERISFAARKN